MHAIRRRSGLFFIEIPMGVICVLAISLFFTACTGKEKEIRATEGVFYANLGVLHSSTPILNFTPVTTKFPLTQSMPISTLVTYDDVTKVVSAFDTYYFHGTLSDYKLRDLNFYQNCDEISYGPYKVGMLWYKTDPKREFRFERTIAIDFRNNLIYASEIQLQPDSSQYSSIDGPIISLEEATSIAESNGGKEFRKDAKNKCTLSGLIGGGIHNEDWIIDYKSDNNSLSFQVDEKTGSVNSKVAR